MELREVDFCTYALADPSEFDYEEDIARFVEKAVTAVHRIGFAVRLVFFKIGGDLKFAVAAFPPEQGEPNLEQIQRIYCTCHAPGFPAIELSDGGRLTYRDGADHHAH